MSVKLLKKGCNHEKYQVLYKSCLWKNELKTFEKKYLLLRSKQSIINKVAKVTKTDCSLKTKQNETLSKS